MAEEADFETQIVHLRADLEQVVKERDIVQKQLTARLLPLHISLLIVLQVLLFASMFAAYEYTEVNRLERLVAPDVETQRTGTVSQ